MMRRTLLAALGCAVIALAAPPACRRHSHTIQPSPPCNGFAVVAGGPA
ncbi:hypothetical protein ACVIW0_007646 [Bradyrhizobium sp. USDA 4454]